MTDPKKVEKAMAVMQVVQSMDKSMWSSKKFASLMFFEVSWKLLLAYGIYVDLDSSVLLAMVTAAGGVEGIGNYVQGKHDEAVKTAKLHALNGSGSVKLPEGASDG